MTDQELLHRVYNMVFEVHQELPGIKGTLIRVEAEQGDQGRRLRKVETRLDRHRTKLDSINEEIDEAEAARRKAVAEAEAKKKKAADERLERRKWAVRFAIGIAATLFIAACSTSTSIVAQRVVPTMFGQPVTASK